MTGDHDFDEVRARLAEEALGRAADPVPHARAAYAAQMVVRDVEAFDLAREQLRMVRARPEEDGYGYTADDLADAEKMLDMGVRELRASAVALLALIGTGDGGGADELDLAQRLNEVLDATPEQGDTP